MTVYKYKYFSVPNILTLLNLLLGILAVYYTFEYPNRLYYAAIFIVIAAVFDFLDGFAARLLRSTSELGKQLDSLADLVSFGLAPASIIFHILKDALNVDVFSFNLSIVKTLVLLSPLLLVLFAALRLAKYNIDKRQTSSFLGLPTPATAIFFASIPLIMELELSKIFVFYYFFDIELPMSLSGIYVLLSFIVFENVYFYLFAIFIFACLMISELPMFSLKFKKLSFKANRIRYSFLVVSFLLFIFMQIFAVPIIIVLYVLLSIAQDIKIYINKKKLNHKKLQIK